MPAPSTLGPARSFRVLVADDHRAFREMLVAVLRADGHEVVAVANGLDLLDTLAVASRSDPGTQRFDLVISDLRMPEADGLRVLAQTAGVPGAPPFLLLTAFGSEEVHAKATGAGALAVLDKPIDFDDLRALVRKVLATAPA